VHLRDKPCVTDSDEFPGAPTADGRLRKHRHDLGHEDHGAKLAAGTTRAIQVLLGLWIVLSLGLVVYALIDAARPRSITGPTSTQTAPTPSVPR
jgi:hypothetical protein